MKIRAVTLGLDLPRAEAENRPFQQAAALLDLASVGARARDVLEREHPQPQ